MTYGPGEVMFPWLTDDDGSCHSSFVLSRDKFGVIPSLCYCLMCDCAKNGEHFLRCIYFLLIGFLSELSSFVSR